MQPKYVQSRLLAFVTSHEQAQDDEPWMCLCELGNFIQMLCIPSTFKDLRRVLYKVTAGDAVKLLGDLNTQKCVRGICGY